MSVPEKKIVENSSEINESKIIEEIERSENGYSILIDTGYVSLIRSDRFYFPNQDYEPTARVVQKTINSSTFFTRLKEKTNSEIFQKLLPVNCRYIKNLGNNNSIMVIEEQPMTRTITASMELGYQIESLKRTGLWEQYGYKGTEDRYKEYTNKFTLAFPYIIYVIAFFGKQFHSMTVHFRLSPITSLNDYLLLAPLYNIPSEQKICLGGWKEQYKNSPSTSTAMEAERVISSFWNTSFNTDHSSNVKKYEENIELNNLFSWQYYSKTDPLFIYKTKWIKEGNTLKSEISKLESWMGGSILAGLNYENLKNCIVQRHLETENLPNDAKQELYNNFCDSIYIVDRSFSVGDECVIKDKKYIIEDFLGNSLLSLTPSYIKVTDENNNQIDLKYDSELIKELQKNINTNNIESIDLPLSKIKIKVGDIIKFSSMETFSGYRKVDQIKRGLDNRVHVKLGTEFFFPETIRAEIFDPSVGISLSNGTMIKEKSTYYIYKNFGGYYPSKGISIFKTENFTSNGNDICIEGRLNNDSKYLYTLRDLESFGTMIESIDDLKEKLIEIKGNIIRVGMYITKIPNHRFFNKIFINPDNMEMCFFQRNREDDYYDKISNVLAKREFSDKISFNDIVIENNTRLYIPGLEFNIDLKINDTVIVADHTQFQISDMIKYRKIVGFVHDKSYGYISVTTSNEDGTDIRNTRYVNLAYNQVYLGLIRKIVPEFGGYFRGEFIKSKVKGMPDFPMKDTVSIVGFIVDTGIDPMVLCSNFATIWFNDLRSSFNRVPGTSTNIDPQLFRKYPIAPGNAFILDSGYLTPFVIMEYIKNESERIILERDKIIRLKLVDYYSNKSICSAESGMDFWKPWGIPVPRLGPSEYINKPLVSASFSFHGGYIKNSHSIWGVRTTKTFN